MSQNVVWAYPDIYSTANKLSTSDKLAPKDMFTSDASTGSMERANTLLLVRAIERQLEALPWEARTVNAVIKIIDGFAHESWFQNNVSVSFGDIEINLIIRPSGRVLRYYRYSPILKETVAPRVISESPIPQEGRLHMQYLRTAEEKLAEPVQHSPAPMVKKPTTNRNDAMSRMLLSEDFFQANQRLAAAVKDIIDQQVEISGKKKINGPFKHWLAGFHLPGGFSEWVLNKDMLYGSRKMWWGKRRSLWKASGSIELAYYHGADGRLRKLSEGARVALIHDGTIAAISDSVQGKTIFVRHDIFNAVKEPLYTMYHYVDPLPFLTVGRRYQAGQAIAECASPGKTGAPSRIGITFAFISDNVPPEDLRDRVLRTRSAHTIDPLLGIDDGYLISEDISIPDVSDGSVPVSSEYRPVILSRHFMPDYKFKKDGTGTLSVPAGVLEDLQKAAQYRRELAAGWGATLVSDGGGQISQAAYPRREEAVVVHSAKSESNLDISEHALDKAVTLIRSLKKWASDASRASSNPDFLKNGGEGWLLLETALEPIKNAYLTEGLIVEYYCSAKGSMSRLDYTTISEILGSDEATLASFMRDLSGVKVCVSTWGSMRLFEDGSSLGEGLSDIPIMLYPAGYPTPPLGSDLVRARSGRREGVFKGLFGIVIDTPAGDELLIFYEPDLTNDSRYRELFNRFWDGGEDVTDGLRALAMMPVPAGRPGISNETSAQDVFTQDEPMINWWQMVFRVAASAAVLIICNLACKFIPEPVYAIMAVCAAFVILFVPDIVRTFDYIIDISAGIRSRKISAALFSRQRVTMTQNVLSRTRKLTWMVRDKKIRSDLTGSLHTPNVLLVLAGVLPATVVKITQPMKMDFFSDMDKLIKDKFGDSVSFSYMAEPIGLNAEFYTGYYILANRAMVKRIIRDNVNLFSEGERALVDSDEGLDGFLEMGLTPTGLYDSRRNILYGMPFNDTIDRLRFEKICLASKLDLKAALGEGDIGSIEKFVASFAGSKNDTRFVRNYYKTVIADSGALRFDDRFKRIGFSWRSMRPKELERYLERYIHGIDVIKGELKIAAKMSDEHYVERDRIEDKAMHPRKASGGRPPLSDNISTPSPEEIRVPVDRDKMKKVAGIEKAKVPIFEGITAELAVLKDAIGEYPTDIAAVDDIKSSNGLILYADSLLRNTTVVDIGAALQEGRSFDNAIVLVYGRTPGSVRIIKEMINAANRTIRVIEVEAKDLGVEFNILYPDEEKEFIQLIKAARAKGISKAMLFGIIKGKTDQSYIDKVKTLANREKAPTVLFAEGSGIYSFSQALVLLMKIKGGLNSGKAWFAELPPLEKWSNKIRDAHAAYLKALELLLNA